MKSVCLLMVVALLLTMPLTLWAQSEADSAKLFKTKCVACHGENGEGKPAMKAPAVKGTTMTVEKMVEYLTKGEAGKRIHVKPVANLDADQAKLVAEYVLSMK